MLKKCGVQGVICVSRLSSEAKSTKFFTTPIYYVNASPHIGHLYSSLIADAAQRWQRMFDGNSNETIFSTGTDEHGTKIQQAALKNATSPIQYCDKISSEFRNLSDEFSIQYTHFIRTSDEKHKNTLASFWNILSRNNHIYKSTYEGHYCVQDETFLSKAQLKEVPGTDGATQFVSSESGHPVEWTSEENYMFRLSHFRDDLIYWLKRDEHVVRPQKFHKILLDLLHDESGGLLDLSISRPAARVHWGIPVPGDPKQTIYVWLDALVNYLTAAGYGTEGFHKYWPPDLQVIGKDILKFHGIYWPAFLMAANLEPPKSILCHSHWTVDGEKMSKSKGNVVCPFERATTYTTDGMRYFLLREGVAHSDGNYSDTKLLRVLNSELADTFGNLLNRCSSSSLNPAQTFPRMDMPALDSVRHLDVTKHLMQSVTELPEQCRGHYENLHFHKVAESVIATLHLANLFFETLKPWQLKKNPETMKELDVVLHLTLETLRVTAILLQPFVPHISGELLDKINVSKNNRFYENIREFSFNNTDFQEKDLSSKKIMIFRRILLDGEEKQKRLKS